MNSSRQSYTNLYCSCDGSWWRREKHWVSRSNTLKSSSLLMWNQATTLFPSQIPDSRLERGMTNASSSDGVVWDFFRMNAKAILLIQSYSRANQLIGRYSLRIPSGTHSFSFSCPLCRALLSYWLVLTPGIWSRFPSCILGGSHRQTDIDPEIEST